MEKKIDFSLSFLFFWIKGFISVDSRFIKICKGNTVLGFIPAGKDNQSIPLKNISSSMVSSQYKIKKIFLGILLILFSLNVLGSNFVIGFLILIIGLEVLSSGIETTLIIQRSGSNYSVSVPFFEKSKLISIQNDITEALAQDTDKTDLNLFFDKK